MIWQFADARSHLTEIVNRALVEGPQRVRCRDDIVVIIAEAEYKKLVAKRVDFKAFLMGKGPSLEGLDLNRDRSPMRRVDL
jgi:antitoxin Phd